MYKRALALLIVFIFILASFTVNASTGDMIVTLDGNAAASNIPTFGSFNYHLAEINGTYYAVWQDNSDYVHIVKSTDKGSTWSDVYNLGRTSPLNAVICADNSGRLHAMFDDNGYARYLRFSGSPLTLDIDKTVGECGTKWSAVYSPVNDVIYWSKRHSDGAMYIVKLDTSGNVLTTKKLVSTVGTWGQTEYWDAHYHSLYVDANGRLHLTYTSHWWAADLSSYIRKKVLYMYSDDQGNTWKKANGATITLPVNANDFTNGGTVISTETTGYGVTLIANLKHVHILYQYDGGAGIKYVRLNRSTGSEEKRQDMPGVSMHSTFVEDRKADKLYIFGNQYNRIPMVQVSDNSGDTWSIQSQILREPFSGGYYWSDTAYPLVTKDGTVIGITTNLDNSDVSVKEVLFEKYVANRDMAKTYRFESTASGSTQVYDGASLRLDGTNQVKDYSGIPYNGNAVSYDNTNFGTYESVDGSVTPVNASNIKGAYSNGFFAKLNYSAQNQQGINLGDVDSGTGVTIEGWFYPTGNQNDALYSGRLVAKRYYWVAGCWSMILNSNGSVKFEIQDSAGYKTWDCSANKIRWNQWNYIAVTWQKGSKDVTFHVKHLDDSLSSETITNANSIAGFPNCDEPVTIGYNAGLPGYGFQGYVDEVSISDYKMSKEELSISDTSYLRFERTFSGTTRVTDNASLRLDGSNQIYDDYSRVKGNPESLNGTSFGTYESVDSNVVPVPYARINGAQGNNYFIKLNYSNKEGINLGDLDVGSGITIEGWFYPTGTQADAYFNTRLVNKRNGWEPGCYYSHFNSNGSISFGIYDPVTYRTWTSNTDVIRWNQWNYVSITWQKDSKDVTFYVRHLDDSLSSQTVTNNDVVSGFPNNSQPVTVGYNTGFDSGFTGYMDEVRISDLKRQQNQLLNEEPESYYRFEATVSGTSITDGADMGFDGTYMVKDSSISLTPNNGNPISLDGRHYRFEATASGTTAVSDGSGLRLDGTYQVKDYSYLKRNGNPVSYNGSNFGTYESSDGGVTPVASSQMKNITSNNYFVKLNHTNKEGIDLGDLDVGSGITIEGWFYPTGTQADAYFNTRLVNKRNGWEPGCYYSHFNSNGSISFGIYDPVTYRTWTSNTDVIRWNQWNYVAITWNKDSKDVTFYVKHLDDSLSNQTVTNNDVVSGFPDSSQPVTIGYNAGFDAGFTGYMDEVRINDYSMNKNQLLVNNGKFLGTYESSYEGITPVSYTQIRDAASNNYFVKLHANNKQEIDIGNIDIAEGMTLEGWFYPSGSAADADTKGNLIGEPGKFGLKLNSNGGVTFHIYDGGAQRREWVSSNSLVSWNSWNYIAVTWQKDSTNATFYIKPLSGSLTTETKTNASVQSGFETVNGPIYIGYTTNNAAPYAGWFDGCLDEVRITGYARSRNQLLLP